MSSMDVPRQRPRRRTRQFIGLAAGVLALIGITATLGNLQAAPPTIDRATVWVDTVKRGEMVRQIQGPGTLVPEHIQWVSSTAAARVEKILVRPGALVEAETVLLELNNPDLQLQALEAERQLSSASAELVNLAANQRSQHLSQRSLVATLSSDVSEARRRHAADSALAEKGFLSTLELSQTLGKAEELAGRLEFEQKRLIALSEGMEAQIAAQKAQVERLRVIAEFRRAEVDGLRLRAGVGGVLQEMPLQVGQWVAPGTLLAKVVRPERLKAEIRIAEIQAKDVQLGQLASIDTRNGLVQGHVSRIDPAVQQGTVKVEVLLDGPLPKGARPDLSVEGTIELERLKDVLYVGRPAFGQSESNVGVFKLTDRGSVALRVHAQLGRASVKTIEIKAGLQEGDQVILSDMSQWESIERVRIQ